MEQSKLPYVAIVGRPNVGKSTLFNRLIQKRISITSEIEGTTRDRIIESCQWIGKSFYLIDTGGYDKENNINLFQKQINAQIDIALDFAQIILFVVSSKERITKEDLIIASKLKKEKNKKIILVINKSDNQEDILMSEEFSQFGFSDYIAISTIHGFNINRLLDLVVTNLPSQITDDNLPSFKIAFIGKPNVGKSSLLNSILNDQRSIVSEIAGTTRDSIDTYFKFKDIEYTLIDTAGIKKNKDSLNDIEYYSELRSQLAIDRTDLVLLLLDPIDGINHIDESLMDLLKASLKPTIVLINKSDLLKGEAQKKEILENLKLKFKFASYYEVIFISALTKRNIFSIFDLIEEVRVNLKQEINTTQLNVFLRNIQMLKQPPRVNGALITLNFIAYHNDNGPHFIIFSNKPDLIHFSYKRFIENQIRKVFNFKAIPIKITYRTTKKEKF